MKHFIYKPNHNKCPVCGVKTETEHSHPPKDPYDIRTTLTYCLPSGITDDEWAVIVNNVKMQISYAKNELMNEIIKLCQEKGGEWELYDLEQYLIKYEQNN